ncbi:hypothetical protein O3P69_020455 [Scylla paramamosain]|uniref:Chitin-binding type-2 domain-containing protein n=1 Tax=Scylla paramamosain TaxID=85552 RepID=A0AAW0TN17_SCYPA
MQLTLILTVCLGVILASAPSDGVPAYFTASPMISSRCPMPPGPYPHYMANPADCGSFYMCSWNIAFLMDCPAGLHFNTELQVCDFPINTHCAAAAATKAHVQDTNTTTTAINDATHAPADMITTTAPDYDTTI